MQFLAEATKTKQTHANYKQKPQFFNQTKPSTILNRKRGYYTNQFELFNPFRIPLAAAEKPRLA